MAVGKPIFIKPAAFRGGGAPTIQLADPSPVSDAIGTVLGSLADAAFVGKKIEQANAAQKAEIEIISGLEGIQLGLERESSLEVAKNSYDTQAKTLRDSALANAPDDATRQRIGFMFDKYSLRTSSSVHKRTLLNAGDEYNAGLIEWSKFNLTDAAINPETDSETGAPLMTDNKNGAREKADEMVDSNLRTQVSAQSWLQNQLATMDFNAARAMVEDSPEFAMELLQQKAAPGEEETGPEGTRTWRNFLDLPEDKRRVLTNMAEAGIRKEVANTNEFVNTAVAQALKGEPVPSTGELIGRGLEGNALIDAEGNINAAVTVRTEFDKLKYQPLNDGSRQETIQGVQDDIDNQVPGFQYLTPKLKWLKNEAAIQRELWNKDPAMQADSLYPLPDPPEELVGGWTWGMKALHRQGVYESMGYTPEGRVKNVMFLTAREAGGLQDTFMNGTTAEMKANMATDIVMGSGVMAVPIVTQLMDDGPGGGHMPPEFVVMVDEDTDPFTSRAVAQTIGFNIPQLIKANFPETTDGNALVVEAQTEFQSSMGKSIAAGDVGTRLAFQDTFVKLSLSLPGGVDSARKSMFGNKVFMDIGDTVTTVRVPASLGGEAQSSIERTLNKMAKNPDKLGIDLSSLTANGSLTAAEDFNAYFAENGGFLTYPDAEGRDAGVIVTMDGGTPMLDTNGNQVRRTWAQLIAADVKIAGRREIVRKAEAERAAVEGKALESKVGRALFEEPAPTPRDEGGTSVSEIFTSIGKFFTGEE